MANRRLTLLGALRRAFDAGVSYGIASHEAFVQIHPSREIKCRELRKRITLSKPIRRKNT